VKIARVDPEQGEGETLGQHPNPVSRAPEGRAEASPRHGSTFMQLFYPSPSRVFMSSFLWPIMLNMMELTNKLPLYPYKKSGQKAAFFAEFKRF
jgi:hypothetical protein